MPSRSDLPRVILLAILALVCLHPGVSSAAALILGLVFGLGLTHPFPARNKQWIQRLLAWSIVGLGAGMNLAVLAQVGLAGVGFTFAGIVLTLILGLGLGRILGTSSDLSLLLCSGTAICGGSAIAAVSATLRARPADISTSLIIIFLLNSVALLIFPALGHAVGLDETQFGFWSALAIHDTSSVVGASLKYGPRALEVGTTVKLARALWIIPLALAIGAARRWNNRSEEKGSFKKPWFILGFILTAALVTWIPSLQEPGQWVSAGAKRLFVLTLFLIGSGFDRESLKALSVKPLIQAVVLWVIVAIASLAAIRSGLISTGL